MGISVTTSQQQITASVAEDKITASVSAGFGATGPAGPQGPQGPAGEQGPPGDPAELPAGTEGDVLTYVSGSWTAAAPAPSFDQSLNTDDAVTFASVSLDSAAQYAISVREDGALVVSAGEDEFIVITSAVSIAGFVFDGFGGSLTFPDSSVQETAWTGSVDAANVTGLATVATTNSYDDLDDLPSPYSLPAATDAVLGGVKIGSGVTITDGVISVSTAYAATSHNHGSITNAGAIGSTSGLVVTTGASGVLGTLAQGTAGQVLKVNSGATGVEWGAAAADVSIDATAADVLSASSGSITADDPGADRIVFWDDSASKLTHLEVGTGLSISGTTITNASPRTKTILRFSPADNQPPASNFATLDTRNSVLVLEFDAATDESAVFVGYIPEGATLTNGLKVRLSWMADTATSGNVRWGVQFEADGTDLDSDSFDTATLATSAANGTSGIEAVAEITATSIDSLAAGDRFRLKVYRDADDATNDTMAGDAQLVAVEVQVA